MTKKRYRQLLIERMGVPVLQKQIKAGSINTAYLQAGNGETVILLHGAGAGAVTWYPTVGTLSQHFAVIAPDIVGYGESDKPNANYDRPYFSCWLRDFMAALGLTKAHIIGLSQGGSIALEFVLNFPDMVDKLVLVGSGSLGDGLDLKPPNGAIFGMLWLNVAPSMLASRFYARFILNTPKNRDKNHERYSIAVTKSKGGKRAFRQGQGKAVSTISQTTLKQIVHKTLIIWGKNDRLFSVAHGQMASKLMSNAEFVSIANAGHLVHIDQPKAFNKTLSEFLIS